MNPYVILLLALLLTYSIVFVIPESAEKFSISSGTLEEGNYWQLFTYQFAHLNLTHLLTNYLALAVVVFLAIELHTRFTVFGGTYLTAGILAVLPIWFVLSFTALGASVAIYAGFGLLSLYVKKFDIRPAVFISVLVSLNFVTPVQQLISCGVCQQFFNALKQAGAHISGLVFGIVAYFIIQNVTSLIDKKRTHILRGDG